ncbi:DUF1289 domain-containing protein [Alteromonas sp. ASW11-130]|uniref:DUF1289 domain-containing protein n=1 Tax=Alteromonas sp. ASW11-130 TaxID=3015775 RepID=UPI002241D1AC|nr:DUF1289 domain-containing protein [Alteromonas sp. ASW11-130]MCW8091591.1 DUF1289 domain-containing protein [Alteromonas sp. ASW11-130]
MAAKGEPSPSQLEFFEVPSPCIGVCQSGPRGFCLGCFRSREERLYWLKIDDATKRKIIAACHRRKKAAQRSNQQSSSVAEPIPSQYDLFGKDKDK